MNAEELYKITKSIMFEKATSKDYENYYLDNINLILSECFTLNNDMREFKGLEKLTTIPRVTKKDDIIPYEIEICSTVLPYGLASRFFIDDDLAKFNIFTTNYENSKISCMRLKETPVVDVYA